MKIIPKLAVMTGTAILLYFTDIPPQPLKLPLTVQWVPNAEAVLGVRRRTRRRAVAVGYAAGASAGAATTAAAAPAPAPAPAPAAN